MITRIKELATSKMDAALRIKGKLEKYAAIDAVKEEVLELYKSENEEVLKDKISYTINFVITPRDRTLEASDIEKFSARLIQTMQKLGINLRQ